MKFVKFVFGFFFGIIGIFLAVLGRLFGIK